ncbi:MAG: helix-turn-helix domain-containing protein [Lachnospiraceae bacterium]|nr:helix-turn-helix domain-containing protein [Lachnospiraceae bacterium]
MNFINLFVPTFPFFVTAGSALYRPGDLHRGRNATGVFDLIYVEYGELFMTENDSTYSLLPGDYLILSPTGKHTSESPVSQKTLFHWIHFAHSGKFTISDKMEKSNKVKASIYKATPRSITIPVHGSLSAEQGREFMHIHKMLSSLLIDNYQHTYIPVDAGTQSALYEQELLCQLLRILQVQPESTKRNFLADNVMDFINQNYYKQITLELLAQKFKFHPAHIIRCLQYRYGVTPIEAVNNVRIEKAQQLLSNTTMPVSEIAAKIGFATPSYFNRLFKKQTGVTPLEYRAQEQGTQ